MGRGNKVVNLVVDTFGNYLVTNNGCIVLRDKEKNEKKYPLSEDAIGEIVLTSGNMVSTNALSALGFWKIDVLIATRNGRPIAELRNLDDDSFVETRISQYEAIKNGKGIEIAKQIVNTKIRSQNQVLKKYGLRQLDIIGAQEAIKNADSNDLNLLRKKLINIEGRFTRNYFEQIFKLFPYELQPDKRHSFLAYDEINNVLNLAYELLFWKCYRALSKAHLETHLGFVHITMQARASLVCDFQELYRYLIDDFVIRFAKNLKHKDFKAETFMFNDKKGKRMFLKKAKLRELTHSMHDYFKSSIEIPNIKRGKRQEIESLINEEAILLAKYIRNETSEWNPRICI